MAFKEVLHNLDVVRGFLNCPTLIATVARMVVILQEGGGLPSNFLDCWQIEILAFPSWD